MTTRFETIFDEIMAQYNMIEWYELFDSENFEEVENRITNEFGANIFDTEEYKAWYDEMAKEL